MVWKRKGRVSAGMEPQQNKIELFQFKGALDSLNLKGLAVLYIAYFQNMHSIGCRKLPSSKALDRYLMQLGIDVNG